MQNVLSEMLYFEYEIEDERSKRMKKTIFTTVFGDAAVDMLPGSELPFYGKPSFDPNKLQTRPFAGIWLTSQGYGQLADPFADLGIATTNKPDTFNAWDQPSGGAFFHLRKDGAQLKRMEKIISFQSWLVALGAGKTEVLAHFPPFSLLFLVRNIRQGLQAQGFIRYAAVQVRHRHGAWFLKGEKVDRGRKRASAAPRLSTR